MRSRTLGLTAVLLTTTSFAVSKEWVSGILWPEPPLVQPGAAPGDAPSDAIVLFGGESLEAWNGGEQWAIADGVATSKGGSITTKEAYGDCQLHVEWATPEKVEGTGQGRGNSGVYLMGKYEVQVLDSFENPTYFDGQAGSLYKTRPPLVNASRAPGQWQTYDIVFRAPRFDAVGHLLRPGYLTVLHNGVLVQDHTELLGTTAWDTPPVYTPHAERLPLGLQFHGNPVQFRNIWLREIPEPAPQRPE